MGKGRISIHTIQGLAAFYSLYNATYFDNTLPECTLRYVPGLRNGRVLVDGLCEKLDGHFTISIREGIGARDARIVLLHEMNHIDLWPKSHRSKAWKKSIKRFADAGFLEHVFN